MGVKNGINIFEAGKDAEAKEREIIGKVSRYVHRGEDFNAFSPDEQKFINMVGDAHRQMSDVANKANKNLVAKNLIHAYKITETDAYRVLKVASEVMLTMEYQDNGYLKLIMKKRIETMMEKAEAANDFKSFIKLFDEYKILTGFNEPEAENLDAIFSQKLEFIPSKKLLNQFFDEGMENFDADKYIKKLEKKAFTKLNGTAD